MGKEAALENKYLTRVPLLSSMLRGVCESIPGLWELHKYKHGITNTTPSAHISPHKSVRSSWTRGVRLVKSDSTDVEKQDRLGGWGVDHNWGEHEVEQ